MFHNISYANHVAKRGMAATGSAAFRFALRQLLRDEPLRLFSCQAKNSAIVHWRGAVSVIVPLHCVLV
jgi:hypothetical protein